MHQRPAIPLNPGVPCRAKRLVPITVTHAASFIPFDPIANPEFSLAPTTFATIFGKTRWAGAAQEAGHWFTLSFD